MTSQNTWFFPKMYYIDCWGSTFYLVIFPTHVGIIEDLPWYLLKKQWNLFNVSIINNKLNIFIGMLWLLFKLTTTNYEMRQQWDFYNAWHFKLKTYNVQTQMIPAGLFPVANRGLKGSWSGTTHATYNCDKMVIYERNQCCFFQTQVSTQTHNDEYLPQIDHHKILENSKPTSKQKPTHTLSIESRSNITSTVNVSIINNKVGIAIWNVVKLTTTNNENFYNAWHFNI